MYRSPSPVRRPGSLALARRFGRLSAFFVLPWLLLAHSAAAGVQARFETRDLQRGSSEYGRLLAQGGEYRMDRYDRDQKLLGSVLIKNGRPYVIDHVKKFWSVVDDLALRRMKADLEAAAAQFDQKVAQMDAESRQTMLGTLTGPQPGSASRDFDTTAEMAEKNGFPCRRYQVLSDGTLVREIWATPWDKVAGAEELRAAQSAMEAYYQRLTSVFTEVKSQLLGVPLYRSPENPFADFGKIEGFAVVTRNFENGHSLAETLLLEVKELPLAASEFEIPADYQQKAMDH